MSKLEIKDFRREAWKNEDSNYPYIDRSEKKEGMYCICAVSRPEMSNECVPETNPSQKIRYFNKQSDISQKVNDTIEFVL